MANKERKNFLKEYKLFAACSKAESDITGLKERIYFDRGYAYATDGMILVRVPLNYCTALEDYEIDYLNGFCIHGKILKLIYGFDVVTVERTMTEHDAYGNTLEDPEEVVYISAVYQGEQIRFRLERSDKEFVKNFEPLLAVEEGYKPLSRIGINTGLLHKISQALNMSSIQMDFTTANKKVYIKSTLEEDQKAGPMAIIMPIQTDATLPGMEEEPEE